MYTRSLHDALPISDVSRRVYPIATVVPRDASRPRPAATTSTLRRPIGIVYRDVEARRRYTVNSPFSMGSWRVTLRAAVRARSAQTSGVCKWVVQLIRYRSTVTRL